MAVVTVVLEHGDMEHQMKEKSIANILALVAESVAVIANYNVDIGALSLFEFRKAMNVNFARFNTDLTVAGIVVMNGGDSWLEVRRKCNTNFALVDAINA